MIIDGDSWSTTGAELWTHGTSHRKHGFYWVKRKKEIALYTGGMHFDIHPNLCSLGSHNCFLYTKLLLIDDERIKEPE